MWALLANGFNTFVQVTEAPAGSVCSAKAFLRSGKEISGPALGKTRTVTGASQPVSWSDQDGQLFTLPSPVPPSGSEAYWQITCVNNAFNPSSGTITKAFSTP